VGVSTSRARAPGAAQHLFSLNTGKEGPRRLARLVDDEADRVRSTGTSNDCRQRHKANRAPCSPEIDASTRGRAAGTDGASAVVRRIHARSSSRKKQRGFALAIPGPAGRRGAGGTAPRRPGGRAPRRLIAAGLEGENLSGAEHQRGRRHSASCATPAGDRGTGFHENSGWEIERFLARIGGRPVEGTVRPP